MLIIIGVLIALTATAAVYRMLLTGRTNTAPFGWMNEKWLAEHRASREARTQAIVHGPIGIRTQT